MLAIRMQRTGRSGHAQYRMIVQESRLTPTSGRVVARLGSYNPHAKTAVLDKEKAVFYLEHGAQPSDRIVKLFESEGIKIPKWVKSATVHARTTRNPEKLRKNRPAEPKAEEKLAENPEPVEQTEEVTAEKSVSEEPTVEETTPEPETVVAEEESKEKA